MLSFTEPAVTVTEADAYAASRAWLNWTGDDEAKEAALRRGQDYIAGLYNARWLTEWDNEEAPEAAKFAIIEAARQELAKPGSLAPIVDAGPQKVLTGVKGINWTVVDDGTDRDFAVLPVVGALLQSLVRAAPGATLVTPLARF